MKTNHLIFTLLTAALILLGGCNSTGYDRASVTTTSLEQTAIKLQQGHEQIDTVLITLSNLFDSPEADIRAQFEQFDNAVKKLETLSAEVSKSAADMKVQGGDYFQKWDAELAKIQNENIRSRSTDRKNTVAARFERVRANYAQTTADFAPFMSDLTDIRTALAVDLTAGGLASIRDAAIRANDNALPLRRSLSDLADDFTSLGISLSPTTAVK